MLAKSALAQVAVSLLLIPLCAAILLTSAKQTLTVNKDVIILMALMATADAKEVWLNTALLGIGSLAKIALPAARLADTVSAKKRFNPRILLPHHPVRPVCTAPMVFVKKEAAVVITTLMNV